MNAALRNTCLRGTGWLIALAGLTHLPVAAQSPALSACKLDEAYEPISMPDREAAGERTIREAALSLGRPVRFDPQPWPRCLEGIRTGAYDFIVGPSANPAFYAFIAYPRLNGQPDAARGIGAVNYVVMRRKASAVRWDGTRFSGLTQPVFYGNTAVIVRRKLDELQVASDDSARYAEQLANMLAFGRIEVGITRQPEAEALMKRPEFSGLEILPHPFVSFEAYLGVNMKVAAEQAAFVEKLWDELGRRRSAKPRQEPGR